MDPSPAASDTHKQKKNTIPGSVQETGQDLTRHQVQQKINNSNWITNVFRNRYREDKYILILLCGKYELKSFPSKSRGLHFSPPARFKWYRPIEYTVSLANRLVQVMECLRSFSRTS
ncbi:hypothetical protein JTE90_006976 [Oedothorax gibbosus]|uniref:Uncharacterized protein n=1 Tax=Oedothorax gibbosus TaxID=931172 RepID=A0AAV6VB14_9ARAC|nr:hypothetical protein JTE90_006976 [Oedothorax gibbosus]